MTNYYPCVPLDCLSVEANSDGSLRQPNMYDFLNDYSLDNFLGQDMLPEDIPIAGVCNSAELAQSINPLNEPNEFDIYFSGPQVLDTPSDTDPNQLALNDLLMSVFEEPKEKASNKKIIPLSVSVGIGTSQRTVSRLHKIELVYDLEEKYRPRYKSDYFALNGVKRRPRYVADRHNNHYISLRVPLNIPGKIRIDWLTVPDKNGDRYVMPYCFQTSNDSSEAEDCNPIYEDIPQGISGDMKLYLVLIKTKQDALKRLQPLRAFQPFQDLLGVANPDTPEKTAILSPKKLIQKYQLGKSQLGFTLCTISADGQTYIPEWDTTVFSSVIEEESSAEISSGKIIACPKCSNKINVDDETVVLQNIGSTKRTSLPVISAKPKTIKKQRTISSTILSFE